MESSDPKEINNAFLCFYQNLYGTDHSNSILQKQKEFLDSLSINPLEENMLTDLDLDITNEELSVAIGTMKGGKTPGLDGIPIDMYKTFQDAVMEILHVTFSFMNLGFV